MVRMILAVAVGAVVVAGALVAVVAMRSDNPSTAPKTDVASVDPPAKPDESAEIPDLARYEADAPAPKPKVEEETPQEAAPQAVAQADNPAAGQGGDDTQVRERMRGLLDSLSDEERRALWGEMGRQRAEQFREARRYMMPTDMRLRALRWYERGAYQLNEAQQTQVNEMTQAMRPRLEAALQGLWAQEEDLRNQAQELHDQGRDDEARAVFDQLREVNQQINEAKAPLDAEYKEMLRGVLSADQMTFLDSNQSMRGGRGFGGRGRDRTGGRRGGNGQ